jgi:hypothetical protein
MSSEAYKQPVLFNDVLHQSVGEAAVSNFRDFLTDTIDRDGKVIKTAAEKYNDQAMARFNDASYALTPEEITTIQSTILEVLMWKPKADGVMQTDQLGMGATKHKFYKWNRVPAPRETMTFEGGRNVIATKQEVEVELLGLDYDFHFSKTAIDAARNRVGYVQFNKTIDVGTVSILTEFLVEYRDKYLFLGSTGAGLTSGLAKTGLLNDANLTDPGAVGNADSLVAAGNVLTAGTDLANFLIGNKFEPPFVLDLSPGVMMQALKNKNATTFISDYKYLKDLEAPQEFGTSSMFADIRINPYMIDSDTEVNATGAMACYKTGFQNFHIGEGYPIGYYPKVPQGLGIDGKILWMGQTILQRPLSVAFANALTTDVHAA